MDDVPGPTIWDELAAWSEALPQWQRYIVALAANRSKLTNEQVDTAYTVLLAEHDLLAINEAHQIEVPAFAGRPVATASEQLTLLRVDTIQGVNALPRDAQLTFGPGFTVIFGRNGAGKSGYGRLFANACFSRQRPSILPDIYGEGDPPAPSAVFHATLGAAERMVTFTDPDEVTPLKRLTVFDAHVARHHITQSSAFEFKPVGFDVFPEMTRVVSELLRRLEQDIAIRTRTNTFPQAFLGAGSPTIVHAAVEALGADTDLVQLRTLAAYGPTESARITELDAQLLALRSKSPKETLARLKQAVGDIDLLSKQLGALAREFTADAVTHRANQIANAKEKIATAAALGADQFKRPFFRAVGSDAWQGLVTAAHALAAREGETYPQPGDRCLLCERPFDEAARAHVEALLKFVESDARTVAAEAVTVLTKEAARLGDLSLAVFGSEMRVREHIKQLSPETEQAVASATDAISSSHAAALRDLKDFATTAQPASADNASTRLADLSKMVADDIERLSADDTEASIASLDQERRVLRHRHVLSQQLAEIEAFVADAKWVRAAAKLRPALSTRPITDKEKDMFGKIVGDSYRERLAKECAILECNVPIELQTVGRSGETVRSLKMPGGHKPETILSEGEQRAVALADFLTEVSHNPSAAGIVFDDPVTSLDHQRKVLIAKRLVAEATARQVIVFTHDLVFLSALSEAADEQDVPLEGHWVDRDNEGRPGKVALGDSPATARLYEKTTRAEEALARAKLLTGSARETEVRTGMGALRRTLEETVVRRLLKSVVPRWQDRVIVTALPKINWDNAKVDEISNLYEDLSRYIEGHSHTDEAQGAPPEPKDLETRISSVNELIKWSRPDRT